MAGLTCHCSAKFSVFCFKCKIKPFCLFQGILHFLHGDAGKYKLRFAGNCVDNCACFKALYTSVCVIRFALEGQMYKAFFTVQHRKCTVRGKDIFREGVFFLIIFYVITAALFKPAENHSEIFVYRNVKIFYSLNCIQHSNAWTLVVDSTSAVKDPIFASELEWIIAPAFPCGNGIEMGKNSQHRLSLFEISVDGVVVSVAGFHPKAF